MGIFIDLKGTTRDTFKIKRATLDASGLTAARTITLPDGNINFSGGSATNILTFDGNNWAPAAAPGSINRTTFQYLDGNWTCPTGVTKAKIIVIAHKPMKLAAGYSFAGAIAQDTRTYIGNAYQETILNWGNDSVGQLGGSSTGSQSTPVSTSGIKEYIMMAYGYLHAAAIDGDNNVYCWGGNGGGRLGDNTTTSKSSPVAVVGGLKFKKVMAGGNHTLGLTLSNDLYAWGGNTYGQLGDNSVTSRSSPVQVVGSLKCKDIAVSDYNCYAITTDGALYAWGLNDYGQLGNNNASVTRVSSPVAVVGGLIFREVKAGSVSRTCFAVTTDNVVYAWGRNSNGLLGCGDLTIKATYTGQVAGMTTDVTIDADYGGTLGNSIQLWFDGVQDINYFINQWNMTNPTNTCTMTSGDWTQIPDNGTTIQLAGGTDGEQSSPCAVLGSLNCKMLAAGDVTAYILTNTNDLYGWGYNTLGAIGDGTNNHSSSPVAVVGGLKFKQVCGGNVFAIAQSMDDIVYCWGANSSGCLGDGTLFSRSSPVAVASGDVLWNKNMPFQASFLLDVTASTVYPVTMLAKYAMFNYEPYGFLIDKLIIEY